MAILDNWPLKLGILLVVLVIAGGAYVVKGAGEKMALQNQVENVLFEKYRAPTEDAWKRAHAELNIPYTEGRRMTVEEMRRYLDKAWAEGIQSAKPDTR
jgi:hypothetical protein